MRKTITSTVLLGLIIFLITLHTALAIECSSAVTGDFTLDSDITGCANHGLVVQASNITINCNNHTIASIDRQTIDKADWIPLTYEKTAGILIKNQNDVKVENCKITQFQDGIRLENAGNNIISNNEFTNNERSGVFLERDNDNEQVSNNVIVSNNFNNPEKFSTDILVYDNENHNMEAGINVFDNKIYLNNFYGKGIIDITKQNIYCWPNTQQGKGNYYDYAVPASRRMTGACGALSIPSDGSEAIGNSNNTNNTNQTDGNDDDDNGDDDGDDDFDNDDEDLPEISLSCGALISGSIALKSDVKDCFATAVEIVEDGVTLDCRGHKISGLDMLNSIGILVSQQKDITIKNCIIEHFDEGMRTVDSFNIVLENNQLLTNSIGVSDLGSEDITAEENLFRENDYGLEFDRNKNSMLMQNTFKENKLMGMHLKESENVVAGLNTFEDNKEAVMFSEESEKCSITSNTLTNNQESGIFLTSISDDNEIKDNTITGSRSCIVIDQSNDNLVMQNTIQECNKGIDISGSYANNITENEISESTVFGLSYVISEDNWITENNFINNIPGSLDLKNVMLTYDNVVVRNNFLGNGVDDSAVDNIYCWPNDATGVGNYYSSNIPSEFIVVGPCGQSDNNHDDNNTNQTNGDDDNDNTNQTDDDTNDDNNNDDDNQTTADMIGPHIYDMKITKIDETSFKISFKTDEDAISMLSYRPDSMERSNKFNYVLTKEHEYLLYDLRPCTVYWFYARAEDKFGNHRYSPEYNFKTEGSCYGRSDGGLSNSEDIQIVSIIMENEYVEAGDMFHTSIKVKNIGEFDRRRVKISVSIPDLGIVKYLSNEHLDDNDKETFRLNIPMPDDTLPGDYWVRYTLSNDNFKKVKHRLLTVI